MKPQSQPQDDFLLFQTRLDQILDPQHPLLRLATRIDWEHFDRTFGELYCENNGAPAKATLLMVGLHYLKHAFNESDESVVERRCRQEASSRTSQCY